MSLSEYSDTLHVNEEHNKAIIKEASHESILPQAYQIKPSLEEKFKEEPVKEIIRSTVTEILAGQTYESEKVKKWTIALANKVNEKIKDLHMKRYRHIVQVIIGEMKGAGVKSGVRCIWDSESDGYTSDIYMNTFVYTWITFDCLQDFHVVATMVSGKEFRSTLRKPLPGTKKHKKCRIVPAFTIQAMQKNTCVLPPPKVSLTEKPVTVFKFQNNYNRGNLPIAKQASGSGLVWKADIPKLDFHYYLPIFFEGLVETEDPYKMFAHQAIHDMITQGSSKVFPCIPQLIIPIKEALNTRNKGIMIAALKVVQQLVQCNDMIGEALVPYYRQLLPVLNIYKDKNVNCGDDIDFSQSRGDNLGDVVNETLEVLEKTGGQDAYINIKYLIPTYESCMLN